MGTFYVVTVLIIIVCVLLILIILVQNSKGGGLASNFASSNQIMGVRKTADFLEKSTWTLAIALLALSLLSVFIIPKNTGKVRNSELRDVENTNKTVPYQAPPQQQQQQGQPQQQKK
ncbi:MAG: preprotein translocase subunit SecG [Bacteroidales bacterium]|jgi:preprotein translocase subunit SecG